MSTTPRRATPTPSHGSTPLPRPPDDPGQAVPGLSPRALALALTALAAALRLSGLGRQSFWYDEAVSVALARHPIADLLTGRIKDQGNPPLYPALLHLWMRLFGSGDGTVRALGALFGAATVPVMLVVARKLVADRVAFLAATLLALSPFHLQMAQEARGYCLLGFFSAVAAWGLLRATERAVCDADAALVRWGPWAVVSLATAAMCWTHYFGFAVALAQALYIGVVHRRARPILLRAAAAYATAALLFAPWLPAMAAQLQLPGNLARSPDSWALHLLATPLVFTVGTALFWKDAAADGVDLTVVLRGLLAAVGTLAGLVAAGLGLVRTWQRTWPVRNRGVLLLLAWLVIPIALPALISLLASPLYNSRYALAASLPYLVLLAAGLYELGERPRLLTGGLLILAMAAATFSTLSWFGRGRPLKHQWRETAAFVEAVRRPDDLILFDSDHNETAYAHYASDPGAAERRVRLLPPPAGTPADRLIGARHEGSPAEDVSDLVNAKEGVWLILSDATPAAEARVRGFFASWRAGPATHLRGIAVQRFERRAP